MPILFTTAGAEAGQIAREIFNVAPNWDNPSYFDPDTGKDKSVEGQRWMLLERRLSKQAWLEETNPQPPWPLIQQVPPIVTFYSFKGGVGRTTALISCAWQLAKQQKRVVAIDLDLEAPGLGSTLEVETERGVLDCIIDYLATGKMNLDNTHGPAQCMGTADASFIEILSAGRLDSDYLEKLSRLDFWGASPWDSGESSPVEDALRSLLRCVRSNLKPDVILLDSRAGLHDLSGLSLHGLAHVDVILGRASVQAYDGFDLTIETLGKRRSIEQLKCVVVHSFTQRDSESEIAKKEAGEFLEKSYESFKENLYQKDDDLPSIEDNTAAHYPWPIRWDQDLVHFSSVVSVQSNLFSDDYDNLLKRIIELTEPDEENDEEEKDANKTGSI